MTTENEIRTRLLEIHDSRPLDKPWCEGYVTSLMDWDIIDEETCDRLIKFIERR